MAMMAMALPSVVVAQILPKFDSFEAAYAENSPTSLVHVDLDGNGTIDIATANRAGGDQGLGSISVFLVGKDGSLSNPVHIDLPENDSYPRSFVAVDLDNDQDFDLVTANWYSDSLTVFVNDGLANFSTYSINTLQNPTSINALDYDNDGFMDIVAASSSSLSTNTLHFHRNNGNHTYELMVAYSIPAEPRDIEIGDLDGDQQPDIGIACRGDDQIELRFNDGNGSFVESVTIDVGYRPRSLVFADLDNDGDQDIAVAMFMDPEMAGGAWIIENKGRRNFEVAQVSVVGRAPHSIAAADLDGDCDIDLMVGHVGEQNMRLLLNDGNSLTFSLVGVSMAAVVAEVALVDIDDNQRIDIVAGHPSRAGVTDGMLSIRRNITRPCEACSDTSGTSDCNNNTVPDICDIDTGQSQDCNANGIPDTCDILNDPSVDSNSNGILDQCDTIGCIADLNEDGIVDLGDFSILLTNWGCAGKNCTADMNRDGQVDFNDFSILLVTYGAACATNLD